MTHCNGDCTLAPSRSIAEPKMNQHAANKEMSHWIVFASLRPALIRAWVWLNVLVSTDGLSPLGHARAPLRQIDQYESDTSMVARSGARQPARHLI